MKECRCMKKQPSPADIEIGNRIRKMRADMDIDANDMAKRLGVTRGAVGNWELGGGIKRENLQKIAAEYDVSFEWLAGHLPIDGVVLPKRLYQSRKEEYDALLLQLDEDDQARVVDLARRLAERASRG